jgi:hypothetical protein
MHRFSKVALGLAALVMSESACAMEEQGVVRLFSKIRETMPNAIAADQLLINDGYDQIANGTDGTKTAYQYRGRNNGISIVIEPMSIPGLASNVLHAVWANNTDETYAARLATLVGKWRGNEQPDLFEDDEGWDTVEWPGEDDGPITGVTVGHQKEYRVTKIWDHQIHLTGEQDVHSR